MMNTNALNGRTLLAQPGAVRRVHPADARLVLLAVTLVSAAVFAPALAGLLLLVSAAVIVRPVSEIGRGLLALMLAALAILGAAVTVQTVPGSCSGMFTLYGLLFMALSTWTSLRR